MIGIMIFIALAALSTGFIWGVVAGMRISAWIDKMVDKSFDNYLTRKP